MAVASDAKTQSASLLDEESSLTEEQVQPERPVALPAEEAGAISAPADGVATPRPALPYSTTPPLHHVAYGWPVPSALSTNPDAARASIPLPEFDDFVLERARVISGRYPQA